MERKRRVLISMPSMHIGGAERSLIGLLESLDRDRYEIDLFLYRHEGEFMPLIPKHVRLLPQAGPYTTLERPVKDVVREGHLYLGFARAAAKAWVKLRSWNTPGVKRTYRQMQYTWRWSVPGLPPIADRHYDAAIGFLGPHDFILDRVSAAVRIGWNHTDYFTIVNPDRKLDLAMWHRLDYIVNVSEACERSFLQVFPELRPKAVVIENIISPEFVRKQAEADVSGEMPDDGMFKIVSVGRFSDAKGFDLAIQACRLLVDAGLPVRWYIVGYGTEEQMLRRLIAEHGLEERFVLLGKRSNPYPYIRSCDLYCQPSRYEGKAVTVREAQILGKPVVITNFPTAGSQLRDGYDGHICEPGIEGIRDGIVKLYADPALRAKLAANCLASDYGNRGEAQRLDALLASAEARRSLRSSGGAAG